MSITSSVIVMVLPGHNTYAAWYLPHLSAHDVVLVVAEDRNTRAGIKESAYLKACFRLLNPSLIQYFAASMLHVSRGWFCDGFKLRIHAFIFSHGVYIALKMFCRQQCLRRELELNTKFCLPNIQAELDHKAVTNQSLARPTRQKETMSGNYQVSQPTFSLSVVPSRAALQDCHLHLVAQRPCTASLWQLWAVENSHQS